MSATQMYLPLGRPAHEPTIEDVRLSTNGYSFQSSTTGMLRDLWAADYVDRLIKPHKPALTPADCDASTAAHDVWVDGYRKWLRTLPVERHQRVVRGDYSLKEGEANYVRFNPVNAEGAFDTRLYDYRGDCRIPLVDVDGEVYRAGARGNDRKTIVSEIMGTAFTPAERKNLLEYIDSPEMWDRLIGYRMCVLRDYGPETERMIREENLSEESRENLLYNLQNLRKEESWISNS